MLLTQGIIFFAKICLIVFEGQGQSIEKISRFKNIFSVDPFLSLFLEASLFQLIDNHRFLDDVEGLLARCSL
jgi:hypothetical protein